MRTRLLSVLMAALMTGLASTAIAQDEIDPEGGDVGSAEGEISAEGVDAAPASGPAKPISAGLLLGYGISLEDGPNGWGLGFGLRGGYNLDAIFLGARFVYYLGESQDVPAGIASTIEVSFNIWELGIEGGYDIDAGGAIIRPGL